MWSQKHVQEQVPQTQQAWEQSYKPTITINHSSVIWENTTSIQNAPNPTVIDVEWDSIVKQHSKANILTCCFINAPHLPVCPWDDCKTPQDFRQVTESAKSLWDSCPQAREEHEMLSGFSRWTQSAEKQAVSFFSLHHCSQFVETLPPYCLLFFGHKQFSSLFSPPDPYTKLLPGGCCSRNTVQAFDPAPDHWPKKVSLQL